MREITEIFNNEVRKMDLRNISKYLTSKGKGLCGYTTYDEGTEAYTLSDYGKKWIESELIPKTQKSVSEKPNKKFEKSK